jgi:hypothetical protein
MRAASLAADALLIALATFVLPLYAILRVIVMLDNLSLEVPASYGTSWK